MHLLSEMPETWNPENDFTESEENNEFKDFKQLNVRLLG